MEEINSFNLPNEETSAAMPEAERIAKNPSVKGYTDLDELFSDLKSEKNNSRRSVKSVG